MYSSHPGLKLANEKWHNKHLSSEEIQFYVQVTVVGSSKGSKKDQY